jgi:hypothetical protein
MALTENLMFRLTDTGVILNTDSVSLPFVDIEKVSGLDSAPPRTTERDHEGQDGGFIDAEFEKGRHISLEGTIYTDGTNMEAYLDSLKTNWALRSSSVPFYFRVPDVGERLLMVKPLGVTYDWNQMRRTGCADARFSAFAEDPRIYDTVLNTVAIDQGGTATTGRSYNKGYSYSYGAPITGGQTNLLNLGNRDTPVVFTIDGAVTNPTIINDTLGVSLRFILTMLAGDQLVVDTQYHTVKLNGVNRRGTLIQPNWFLLGVGTNYIRYQADTPGTSTCTATYRSAWR